MQNNLVNGWVVYTLLAVLCLPICALANQAPISIVPDQILIDKIGKDKLGIDKIVTDKIVTDKIVTDKMVTDKLVTDKLVTDKILSDKMLMLRSMISEGAEDLRMNLLTPGFTLLVSVFSVWSILDLLLKIVGLLTRTGSIKTNLLLVLHEVFIGYVTNGIAGSFLGNLPPAKNPVLSTLSTLTNPAMATQRKRRRYIRELSDTAYQAFHKYSVLQYQHIF